MHYLIGDKKSFAVELDISTNKWKNKTAIWLNHVRIGDWDDENVLAPFVRSMYRIATEHDMFSLDEIERLDCKKTYSIIHPFYLNPDAFFDLTSSEQVSYFKYDKFLLDWGENINSYGLTMVFSAGICKFIWDADSEKTREACNFDLIICHEVPVLEVMDVYSELKTILKQNELSFSFLRC